MSHDEALSGGKVSNITVERVARNLNDSSDGRRGSIENTQRIGVSGGYPASPDFSRFQELFQATVRFNCPGFARRAFVQQQDVDVFRLKRFEAALDASLHLATAERTVALGRR